MFELARITVQPSINFDFTVDIFINLIETLSLTPTYTLAQPKQKNKNVDF